MQRMAREAGLQAYALVTIAQDSVMFAWTYTKDAAGSGEAEVRRGDRTGLGAPGTTVLTGLGRVWFPEVGIGKPSG